MEEKKNIIVVAMKKKKNELSLFFPNSLKIQADDRKMYELWSKYVCTSVSHIPIFFSDFHRNLKKLWTFFTFFWNIAEHSLFSKICDFWCYMLTSASVSRLDVLKQYFWCF